MKKQFVKCKTYRTAFKRCSWAKRVLKIESGFICYESVEEYKEDKWSHNEIL